MAIVWWLPTLAVLGLMVGGAGGAYLRVFEPGPGFRLFGLGIILAGTCALVLSAAAAVASARGLGWRGPAVRAAAVPVGISLVLLVLILTGGSHPIHDVTTDQSIGFPKQIAQLRPVEDYPAVLALQKETYPDIAPLDLKRTRDEVFVLAVKAANTMPGWTITETYPRWGRIYATAESRLFHFVDDVSILIEHARGAESMVHMRSRSRIGQSDLGANAARIRAYLEAVEKLAK